MDLLGTYKGILIEELNIREITPLLKSDEENEDRIRPSAPFFLPKNAVNSGFTLCIATLRFGCVEFKIPLNSFSSCFY